MSEASLSTYPLLEGYGPYELNPEWDKVRNNLTNLIEDTAKDKELYLKCIECSSYIQMNIINNIDIKPSKNSILFTCGHTAHVSCLNPNHYNECSICKKDHYLHDDQQTLNIINKENIAKYIQQENEDFVFDESLLRLQQSTIKSLMNKGFDKKNCR